MTYLPLENAHSRDRSPVAARILQMIRSLRLPVPTVRRPPFHLTHHMARDMGLEDSAHPTRTGPATIAPPRHPML